MLLNHQTFGTVPNHTCRGLLPTEYSFLTLNKKETWQPPGQPTGAKLKSAKLAVLRFLSTGAFTDRERFLPTLIGCAHSINEDSTVVSLAEEIFKRSASSIDLNDEANFDLIEVLYHYFFFGEGGNDRTNQYPPVRWTFRARIINILSKSAIAVSSRFARRIMGVVEMALAPASSVGISPINIAVSDTERDRKKLRAEVFVYLNKVSTTADQQTLELHGPAMVERLRYYIVEEGERAATSRQSVVTTTVEDFRGPAYEAIGMFCRRLLKSLVYEPELGLLKFLFHALKASGTPPGVRSSVEGALSSLLVGFSSNEFEYDEDIADQMAQFLVDEVEEEEVREDTEGRRSSGIKYMATRFAVRSLPFDNVKGRWICIMAATTSATDGGSRLEVVEEGKRGLDPYWYRMLNPVPFMPKIKEKDQMELDGAVGQKKDIYAFPVFSELIAYIMSPHFFRPESKKALNNVPIKLYPTAMDFCRRVFIMEALSKYSEKDAGKTNSDVVIDVESFSTKLDTSMATDEDVRGAVANLLASYYSEPAGINGQALEALLTLAFDGMIAGIPRCVEVWVELCALAPQDLISVYASNQELVDKLISMVLISGASISDLEKQNQLIKALVAVVCHPACRKDVLNTLVEKLFGLSVEGGSKAYMGIVGIGSLFGRLRLRDSLTSTLASETIRKGLELVLQVVMDGSTTGNFSSISVDSGLQSLIELCAFGTFSQEDFPFQKLTQEGGAVSIEDIITRLTTLASKNNKEKAVLALGCFSLILSESAPTDPPSPLDAIGAALYKLHESKQVELLFAAGEALSIYSSAWGSKSLTRRYLDVQGCEPPLGALDRRRKHVVLNRVLDKVLGEFSKSTKPMLRKSACVWLLSLVEFSGDLEPVKARLRDMQMAFKGFLVDKDGIFSPHFPLSSWSLHYF